MQKMLLIVAIMLISSCSVFVAEHLGDERAKLVSYGKERSICADNSPEYIETMEL